MFIEIREAMLRQLPISLALFHIVIYLDKKLCLCRIGQFNISRDMQISISHYGTRKLYGAHLLQLQHSNRL